MNRLSRFLFASFFALILVSFTFNQTTAAPQWVSIYRIIALGLLFGGLGFGVYGYQVYGLDGRFGILLFTYLLCMLVLIGVVFQQMGPGFPAPGRMAKLTLIALLFLFFVSVCPQQRTFLKKTGVYVLSFGVLLSIFFYHSAPLSAASGSAGFPITAGFISGLSLFVLPRYVSRDAFFWILSVLSCVTVLISIPVYYIGNYTFLGMEVQLWSSSFTPLFMNGKITVLQSVFSNPNTFAVLTFSGTVAAAILAFRQFPGIDLGRDRQPVRADGASATVLSYSFVRSLGLFSIASIVFAINGIGTYLSYSRASMLAAAFALTLYFSYVSLGRRSLPYALGALIAGFALLMLILPSTGINPGGRFALWSGGIQAILSNPTLLGRGIIAPSEVIAPFVEQQHKGKAIHNSYLSLTIRAGLLGGLAYLVIIIGSLVSGAIRYEKVDVPALALAFGFAIHQMFETYSLFQSTIPAVIAALAFGYLILNGSLLEVDDDASDESDRSRRRRSWSRPEWNR